MTFAERLKHYRELAGYKTGKEFAEHLNIPYPSYMAYENRGREPKYNLLCKICDSLHVSIDELLGHTRKGNVLNASIIGMKIKEYRKLRQFSLKKFSEMTCIPEIELKYYENGIIPPSLEAIARIALELCVSIDFLLDINHFSEKDYIKGRLLACGFQITEIASDEPLFIIKDKSNYSYLLSESDFYALGNIQQSKEYKSTIYSIYLTCLLKLERNWYAHFATSNNMHPLLAKIHDEKTRKIIESALFIPEPDLDDVKLGNKKSPADDNRQG